MQQLEHVGWTNLAVNFWLSKITAPLYLVLLLFFNGFRCVLVRNPLSVLSQVDPMISSELLGTIKCLRPASAGNAECGARQMAARKRTAPTTGHAVCRIVRSRRARKALAVTTQVFNDVHPY